MTCLNPYFVYSPFYLSFKENFELLEINKNDNKFYFDKINAFVLYIFNTKIKKINDNENIFNLVENYLLDKTKLKSIKQNNVLRYLIGEYLELFPNELEEAVKLGYFILIPCRKCDNCRKAFATNWAKKIQFEINTNEILGFSNYFITLTYNDAFVPVIKKDNKNVPVLSKNDARQFIKNLKNFYTNNKIKNNFKFYLVGEYGENTHRPHYHVCLLGIPPLDLTQVKFSKDYYYAQCEFILRMWKLGHILVSPLNSKNAIYTAIYSNKFVPDDIPDKGFPPFSICSNNIGKDYLINNIDNILNYGFSFGNKTIFNCEKFTKLIKEHNPERFAEFSTKNLINNQFSLSDFSFDKINDQIFTTSLKPKKSKIL